MLILSEVACCLKVERINYIMSTLQDGQTGSGRPGRGAWPRNSVFFLVQHDWVESCMGARVRKKKLRQKSDGIPLKKQPNRSSDSQHEMKRLDAQTSYQIEM